MSIKDVTSIIERAGSDTSFLNQLNSNPDQALSGYSLTADERSALIGGDMEKLEALGVDARISKGIWQN